MKIPFGLVSDLLGSEFTRTGVNILQVEEILYAACGVCEGAIFWEWDKTYWYCSECPSVFSSVPKSAGSSSLSSYEPISDVHEWVTRWTGLGATEVSVTISRED